MLRSRGSSRVSAWKPDTNQFCTATRSDTAASTRVMSLLFAASLPAAVAYGLAPQPARGLVSSSCTSVSQPSEWSAR